MSTSQPVGQNIPNYLVQAILVTVFCCLPFGIVSIVYAAQVNGKLAGGDVSGAIESSNNAKKWCWIAFIVGIIAISLILLIQFVFLGTAITSMSASDY